MTDENQPTSDWEHSHALNEGDVLEDTTGSTEGPFEVATIHDDGSVTLRDAQDNSTERHPENEINGALAHGNFERHCDGKSHELATF